MGVAQGGLMGGDDAEIVNAFIDQTGVTFPVGWDTSGSYFDYPQGDAISPFPLDVVVDREGNVAYFNREYNGEELRAVIEALNSQP